MTIAPVFPDGLDSFYDAATLALHNDEGGPATTAPDGTSNLPENRAQYDERIGAILQQIEIRVGWLGDSNTESHETRILTLEATGGGGSGIAPSVLNAQTVLGAISDDVPVPIAIGEQTVLGRVTGGNVTALNGAQLKTILSLGESDISGLATDLSTLSSSIGSVSTTAAAKLAKSANLSDLASRDTAVTTLLGTALDISALPTGMKQGETDTLMAVQDGMPVSITSQQLFAGGITSGTLTNGGLFSILDTGLGVLASFADVAADQPKAVIGTFLGAGFFAMGPGGSTFPDANITWSETNTLAVSNALRVNNAIGVANRSARWVGGSGGGVPSGIVGEVGDFLFDRAAGCVLVCTVAGAPGTWVSSISGTSPTFLNTWTVWDGTAAHGAVGAVQTTFSAGVGWSLVGVYNVSTDGLPSAGAQQIGGQASLGMGPGGSSSFDILFTRVNSTNFTVQGKPTFLNDVNLGNGSNVVNVLIGNSGTGTKFGTSTGSLMGFWNATPSAQIGGGVDLLAGLVTIGLRAASSNPPLDLGTGAISAGTMELRAADATHTSAPTWLVVNNTYTIDFSGAAVGTFLSIAPTVLLNQSGNAFGMAAGVSINTSFKNVAGVAANFGFANQFNAQITYTADTQTGLTGSIIDFTSSPTTAVANSGTMALSTVTGYSSGFAVGTGTTVTTRTGLVINNATGGGTLTTQIGIDIAAFTKGGTNIGIRCKPQVQLGSSGQCVIDTSGSVATSGSVLSSGTGGVGYSTGAGGTVTQLTGRTTGVTLDKICGKITLFSTTIAGDTDQTFTFTNATIAAGDLISFNIIGGAAVKGAYLVNAICAAGSATITVRNVTPTTSATEAPQIAFWVHKGVTA